MAPSRPASLKHGKFEAWKPVSGARVTGIIKMAETRLPGIDISISTTFCYENVVRAICNVLGGH